MTIAHDNPSLLIVGAGGCGRQWAEWIGGAGDWDIVAIVDRDGDRAAETAAVAGLCAGACFADLRAAVEAVHADAALIATPYFAHGQQVVDALSEALNVLVEKPLVQTLAEARELLALARRARRVVAVGEDYRYDRHARKMRELIAGGAIGEPRVATIDYFRYHAFPAGDWRCEMPHAVLLENSVHHFDLMRYVLGAEPAEVRAVEWSDRAYEYTGATSAHVHVRMESDLRISYTASWDVEHLESDWLGRWHIAGTSGGLCLDRTGLWLDVAGVREPVAVAPETRPRNLDLLAEFRAAILGGPPPGTEIADNLRTVAFTEAAMTAAATGQVVKVGVG